MNPQIVRSVFRATPISSALCILSLCLSLGCLRKSTQTLDVDTTIQGPTLTADLVPLSVPAHNLHLADSYWLAAGDAVKVTNSQHFQFSATESSDPSNDFTCTLTPDAATCGGTILITPMGFPIPGADVLECPGQSAACMDSSEKVVQSLTFPWPEIRGLDNQQFNTAGEDGTYSLRPTINLDGRIYQGTPVGSLKITSVPTDMTGRTFSPTLVYNDLLPSGEKWQWPVDNAAWNENFSSNLHVTTISVNQGGQPIPFCGVTVESRNCGCDGNQTLNTSCQMVDLTKCANFNGLVVTPTYILTGVPGRLQSPDDRAQWRVRFAAQGCGLTPPPATADLTLNFTVVAK